MYCVTVSVPHESGGPPRLLTLSVVPVDEYRTRYSRWSGLFEVFERRYPLRFARPELTPREEWVSRARHLHPRRSTVLARSGFSEDTFARRSRHADAAVRAEAGQFDVVFQLQTVFAPGLHPTTYVIYSDTTFARVWSEWPAWAPIGRPAAERFMDLERRVSNGAHTIFAMSEHARRSFVDEYGCDPDRVVNVGTAMALPPTALEARSWREPVALFVGQDFGRKGGRDLLAAWPAVRERVPGAELVIVGPRLPRLSLPEGVRWLGRVSDRAQLAQLYESASLFVLPALFDPMPWVLGEAMAHGLACVVTPSCGMPEVVEDGVTGRLVAPGDPRDLARTLAELLLDEAARERMGRAGHARITTTSSWDDVADRMAPRIELASAEARAGRVTGR
jgi:glycosyltransferase involved in cell wall biosynthesis